MNFSVGLLDARGRTNAYDYPLGPRVPVRQAPTLSPILDSALFSHLTDNSTADTCCGCYRLLLIANPTCTNTNVHIYIHIYIYVRARLGSLNERKFYLRLVRSTCHTGRYWSFQDFSAKPSQRVFLYNRVQNFYLDL